MHRTTLSGDEAVALLIGILFALACIFLVLFFLSSKRHTDELGVIPKFEFRSAYVSGSSYLRLRMPFPTMRVAIYDAFMVFSTLRPTKISYLRAARSSCLLFATFPVRFSVNKRRLVILWSLALPVAAQEVQSFRLPLAATPTNAAALAERAVSAARDVDGLTLDYSPSSLKEIDKVILGFRQSGLTMNEVGETVFVFGCYVGEVIVRSRGASWTAPDEKLQRMGFDLMGVRLKDGTFLDPIGKAMKLLRNGSEDSLVYFYASLVER